MPAAIPAAHVREKGRYRCIIGGGRVYRFNEVTRGGGEESERGATECGCYIRCRCIFYRVEGMGPIGASVSGLGAFYGPVLFLGGRCPVLCGAAVRASFFWTPSRALGVRRLINVLPARES